uniref:Nuclear speckle splicing regulatory protein 1 N-terminal domain-containing protein n=1 Tax=Salix viminalis TaxID=40686 RepID=A0A6N2M4N9_SALVM
MKKYGLLLRQPQQKKPPRPPLPTALGFGEEEDDIEDTHKKALEEDPSVFDYDGVYYEMKQKIAQPKA